MNWFCWHVGTVTDPKLKLVSRQSGQSLPIVISAWAVLLETAAAAHTRGFLENFGPLELSASLDIEVTAAEQLFACFFARQLISNSGQIVSWDKRQHKSSTERVQKYRERRLLLETHETLHSVSSVTGNVSETAETHETPTVHNRTVQDIAPTTEINPSAFGEISKARASRLPADWVPSEKLALWFKTERPDLNLSATADHFRDYWHAKAGKGATKLNWELTFKNWARNQRAINGFAKPVAKKPPGYGSQPG